MAKQDERNYQMQGNYTRYHDGLVSDRAYKGRNFKTLESAIKAAKKELKRNQNPAITKYEEKRDHKGKIVESHMFAEDGHELKWSEHPEFWHVDSVKVVDRQTQKLLWFMQVI